MNLALRESEPMSGEERAATAGAQQIEDKPLVLLQVNCRSILNKTLEFWNLVDTYNPDVIIGTESWLREEINNVEVLGTITQPSGETDVLEGEKCSFVLKTT